MILIVEDDAGSRLAFRTVLEAAGYIVTEAACGKDAASLLEKGLRPSVILLDLRMPHGPEFVLDWVKRHSREEQLPVVILSAYMDDLKDEWVEGLLVDAVDKPVAAGKMLELVGKYEKPARRFSDNPPGGYSGNILGAFALAVLISFGIVWTRQPEAGVPDMARTAKVTSKKATKTTSKKAVMEDKDDSPVPEEFRLDPMKRLAWLNVAEQIGPPKSRNAVPVEGTKGTPPRWEGD